MRELAPGIWHWQAQSHPQWRESRDGVRRESRIERLRPLLEKPVEHVLATHGGPFDPDDLRRALT